MKQENDLQYLRRRLAETVGHHHRIAAESGVPQSTVSRIHLGHVPRLDTAMKLRDYLKKMERKTLAVVRRGRGIRAAAQPAATPALRDPAEQQHDDERSLANL
jgi:predicted transcriptional regulator